MGSASRSRHDGVDPSDRGRYAGHAVRPRDGHGAGGAARRVPQRRARVRKRKHLRRGVREPGPDPARRSAARRDARRRRARARRGARAVRSRFDRGLRAGPRGGRSGRLRRGRGGVRRPAPPARALRGELRRDPRGHAGARLRWRQPVLHARVLRGVRETLGGPRGARAAPARLGEPVDAAGRGARGEHRARPARRVRRRRRASGDDTAVPGVGGPARPRSRDVRRAAEGSWGGCAPGDARVRALPLHQRPRRRGRRPARRNERAGQPRRRAGVLRGDDGIVAVALRAAAGERAAAGVGGWPVDLGGACAG